MFALLIAAAILYFMWFWIGWWIIAVVVGFFALGIFLAWAEAKHPDWFPPPRKRRPGGLGIEFEFESSREIEVTIRARDEDAIQRHDDPG